jgi:hypothetical protein
MSLNQVPLPVIFPGKCLRAEPTIELCTIEIVRFHVAPNILLRRLLLMALIALKGRVVSLLVISAGCQCAASRRSVAYVAHLISCRDEYFLVHLFQTPYFSRSCVHT